MDYVKLQVYDHMYVLCLFWICCCFFWTLYLCIIYKRCYSFLQNDGSFTVDASFNAPAPIDETAMEDEPLPTEIVTGPVETTYRTVSAGTSRGNLKLVDNIGFTYTVKVNKKSKYLSSAYFFQQILTWLKYRELTILEISLFRHFFLFIDPS